MDLIMYEESTITSACVKGNNIPQVSELMVCPPNLEGVFDSHGLIYRCVSADHQCRLGTINSLAGFISKSFKDVVYLSRCRVGSLEEKKNIICILENAYAISRSNGREEGGFLGHKIMDLADEGLSTHDVYVGRERERVTLSNSGMGVNEIGGMSVN